MIIFESPECPGVPQGGGLWPPRGVLYFGSHEELHELTALCPIGAYLSFDIKPLIDLDTSFPMGRDRLPPGINASLP